MTDAELTALCAEAIGITPWSRYNPLCNDAQAFFLMRALRLYVLPGRLDDYCVDYREGPHYIEAVSSDLNRAIVECAAKVQLSLASSVTTRECAVKD